MGTFLQNLLGGAQPNNTMPMIGDNNKSQLLASQLSKIAKGSNDIDFNTLIQSMTPEDVKRKNLKEMTSQDRMDFLGNIGRSLVKNSKDNEKGYGVGTLLGQSFMDAQDEDVNQRKGRQAEIQDAIRSTTSFAPDVAKSAQGKRALDLNKRGQDLDQDYRVRDLSLRERALGARDSQSEFTNKLLEQLFSNGGETAPSTAPSEKKEGQFSRDPSLPKEEKVAPSKSQGMDLLKAGAVMNNPQLMNLGKTILEQDKYTQEKETGRSKDKRDFEYKLLSDYDSASKDFVKVRDGFANLRTAAEDNSPAGDIQLIFSFMKTQDPNSTVREGEFATAQNTTGIPERTRVMYNQALSGQRLSPKQRQEFLRLGQKNYDVSLKQNLKTQEQFRKRAEKFGVNPDNVISDYSIIEPLKVLDPRIEAAKKEGYSEEEINSFLNKNGLAK